MVGGPSRAAARETYLSLRANSLANVSANVSMDISAVLARGQNLLNANAFPNDFPRTHAQMGGTRPTLCGYDDNSIDYPRETDNDAEWALGHPPSTAADAITVAPPRGARTRGPCFARADRSRATPRRGASPNATTPRTCRTPITSARPVCPPCVRCRSSATRGRSPRFRRV